MQTRKPTGKPHWPLVLLSGTEKSGKSYAAAAASASPLIGKTYWISFGEDDPDEYGQIGRFEVAVNYKHRVFTSATVQAVTENEVTLLATMAGKKKDSHTLTMAPGALKSALANCREISGIHVVVPTGRY